MFVISVACGGIFTTPTGLIRSPYFPDAYPSNRQCEYFINQPTGSRVTLTFNTFDIEGGPSEGNCAYDYLEVRPKKISVFFFMELIFGHRHSFRLLKFYRSDADKS